MPSPLAMLAALSLASASPQMQAPPPSVQLVGTGVPMAGQPLVGVSEMMHAGNGLQILLTASAKVGLGGGFDVGASLDHSLVPLLGARTMTAAHLSARKLLSEAGPERLNGRLAVYVDVSAAWFGSPPQPSEPGDPRLWTGLRDYNAELGAWLSTGTTVGLFARAAVIVSMDTHPPSGGPLGGVPPAETFGATAIVDLGSHLDVARFHGVTGIRLMLHSRPDDEKFSLVTFVGLALG
jgi:hypothetical protein